MIHSALRPAAPPLLPWQDFLGELQQMVIKQYMPSAHGQPINLNIAFKQAVMKAKRESGGSRSGGSARVTDFVQQLIRLVRCSAPRASLHRSGLVCRSDDGGRRPLSRLPAFPLSRRSCPVGACPRPRPPTSPAVRCPAPPASPKRTQTHTHISH